MKKNPLVPDVWQQYIDRVAAKRAAERKSYETNDPKPKDPTRPPPIDYEAGRGL